MTEQEKLDVGDWAKSLKEHPFFKRVMNGMVAEIMTDMMSTPVGSNEAVAMHAKLMGANSFAEALTVLANDAAMIRNRNKK